MVIKDNSTDNAFPRTFFRSEQITLSTSAAVNCSGILSTRKRWTVQSVVVDPETHAEELTSVDIAEVAPDTAEMPTLIIPPRTLEYGLYKFRFFSRMWDEDDADPALTHLLPFERDAFTYMEIVPTPLVAGLFESPMGYVTRGKGQTLTLEPYKYSYDPDYPELEVRREKVKKNLLVLAQRFLANFQQPQSTIVSKGFLVLLLCPDPLMTHSEKLCDRQVENSCSSCYDST